MRFAERERAKSPGSAPEPVTFLGRARKVTKRDPPLVSRACAFPVLLDEFGVCGTRSKNEKTHMGCELRQVLDHGTELACVTRQLTRGPKGEERRRFKLRYGDQVEWLSAGEDLKS